MASPMISHLKVNDLKPYFAEAIQGSTPAFCVLIDSLQNAPNKAYQWAAFTRNAWCEAMENIFRVVEPGTSLPTEQRALLKAMLKVGLDSELLRRHYRFLFREEFPNCSNPDTVLDSLGFSDSDKRLSDVADFLRVYRAIEVGASFWDKLNGLGTISEFNESTGTIKVDQGGKEKTVKLPAFTKTEAVIIPGSVMEKLINKTGVSFSSEEDLLAEAKKGIVLRLEGSEQSKVKEILIPTIYSPEEFKKLCTVVVPVSSRWDASRSLKELEDRLKEEEKSKASKGDPSSPAEHELTDINWENVKGILSKDLERLKAEYLSSNYTDRSNRSDRIERAVSWANSVSLLCKTPGYFEIIANFLRDFMSQTSVKGDLGQDADIIRRKCLSAFVEITDNLPGKQVLAWMQLIKTLAGEAFLIDGTMLMPFRLWAHTETLLASKEERQRFQDRVFEDFKHGKPTADHYAWLWKNRKSPNLKEYQDLLIRFLGDCDLLFKTLHRDLKGNYLKSQREIRRLLIDDEEFKSWLMKQGNPTAIKNLVRCVNRLPLLGPSEKQSVLVKIVRIYPEALEIVEESASTKQEQERLSSIHSQLRLQQELAKLVNEEIPANTAQIEDARSRGDLSENSEYTAAKERQRELNKKRAELERNLNNCAFIDFAQRDFTGAVAPGCVVTLRMKDGKEQVITLLGLFDTDLVQKWYSYDSPLGRTLMGHEENDTIVTPEGLRASIAKIEKLPEGLLEILRK